MPSASSSHDQRFASALDALSAMEARGWRLELDRMDELARRLGVPSGGQPRYLHVTGTNGKGSTTAFIQNILHGQGWVVGGYYSPYVNSVLERVQLGLDPISEADFTDLMELLLPVADGMVGTDFGGPTEFEAKTALGFMYWNHKRCDAVALEVGLGGRLDATNIVDPAVSVIVSIALDHTKILGDTLAAIATEKAGIIKPGRPVIVGDIPEEAAFPIVAKAAQTSSEVWRFGHDIDLKGTTLHLPTRSFAGSREAARNRR